MYYSWRKYAMKLKIIVATLAAVLIAAYFYGKISFERAVGQARQRVEPAPATKPVETVTEKELARLPPPVQRWLRNSGIVGKTKIRSTRLLQSAEMRLRPDQKDWAESNAEQWINLESPAFVWTVKMKMATLPVRGMDQFIDGQGSMWITFLGLIPVVQVESHPKINQSALQRFLGEIIWSPSAALAPWVEWTGVDELTARAKMTWAGVTGEAVFYFDEKGDLKKFVAMRFKEVTDEQPLEWHADVKEIQTFNGIRIPSSLEATWMLPEGPYTWLRFKLQNVQYDY